MNYSKQRESIIQFLRWTKTHPTASEIYTEMKKSTPRLSLGTVYRNLALLTEKGLITRIDTEHDSVHYDAQTAPHYHFVCNSCGRVLDIELEPIELNAWIEEQYGCNISGHTLIFYGLCKECKG